MARRRSGLRKLLLPQSQPQMGIGDFEQRQIKRARRTAAAPRVKADNMPNASAQGLAHGKPFQGGGFNPPGLDKEREAEPPRSTGFTGGFTPPGHEPLNIPKPPMPMPEMNPNVPELPEQASPTARKKRRGGY